MEQLENITVQEKIKHRVDWDEYDERIAHEFDKECED